MLPGMNAPQIPQTTENRPFDRAACQTVLASLHGLEPDDTVALVLHARAPDDDFELVLDECWERVVDLAAALRTSVSDRDVFIDKTHGALHVRATPNFTRALVQETNYFWAVTIDQDRWR